MSHSLEITDDIFNSAGVSRGPGLFLWHCFASLLIITGIIGGIYYLIEPRLLGWGTLAQYVAGGIVVSFMLVLGGGFALIAFTVLTGIDVLYPHGKMSLTVKFLFPVATLLSRLSCVSRDKLRESFVCVNNAMTKAQRKRLSGDRLLILLPHCLQVDKCNRNVTHNINNCRECGGCLIGELKKASDRFSVSIDVVNGGTLARKRVAEHRPTGIIAVACERDLTLGIQDVYPIPVIGVINERPYGPCHNTSVNINKVNTAIEFFKNSN